MSSTGSWPIPVTERWNARPLQQVSDRMPDSRVAADLKAIRDDMAARPPKVAAPGSMLRFECV